MLKTIDSDDLHILALCEMSKVVLRPNTLYVFEPVEGCTNCETLLTEANETYAIIGEAFDYNNPYAPNREEDEE